MTDYPEALAALREARTKFNAEVARVAGPQTMRHHAEELSARVLDFLDALDAARGQAVATVQTITSLAGETRKCIIGPAEVIDSLPVGTAVYAAPPAAAVPEGYAGCTLWRDGLRVTVIGDEVIEQRTDADEAFCELAQRALDSLAAAWDSRNAAIAAIKGETK